MFELPDLPYGYDALEPVLSEVTLQLHHGKHHARYVAMTNSLADGLGTDFQSLEDLVALSARRGQRQLFNNAGQAWNHGFFWQCMTPVPTPPAGDLAKNIEAQFGSLDALRTLFIAEGTSHFGSGWAWLVAKGEDLAVITTHDAGSPLNQTGVTPLLVCDLWEHAYYLDHQSDRAAFLSAWWDKLAYWGFAGRQYAAANGESAAWRYPKPVEPALS